MAGKGPGIGTVAATGGVADQELDGFALIETARAIVLPRVAVDQEGATRPRISKAVVVRMVLVLLLKPMCRISFCEPPDKARDSGGTCPEPPQTLQGQRRTRTNRVLTALYIAVVIGTTSRRCSWGFWAERQALHTDHFRAQGLKAFLGSAAFPGPVVDALGCFGILKGIIKNQ